MNEFSDLQNENNNPTPQSYPNYGYKTGRKNGFMIASLCLGIFALTSSSIIFIAMIAGSLSILFAVLSKGNDKKMQPISKLGTGVSVFSILLSFCITASAIYMYFNDASYHAALNDSFKQMYGITMDEALEDQLPSWFSNELK